MFTNSNIQVSHAFTIIGLIADSTLKFINDTRSKIFGNFRIGEHIGISPLTRKQVKPKNSFIADHLLLCNHSASYDDFNILMCEKKTFLLELKESLLIMRDKPSLNRNITSAPLYLFDKA